MRFDRCTAFAVGLLIGLAIFGGGITLCLQGTEVRSLLRANAGARSPQRTHIAVAVAVGPSYVHQLEFLVMLHSSWQYVVSTDDGASENAWVDLLVSCEKCEQLPLDCSPIRPNRSWQSRMEKHRCLYARNHDPEIDYFKLMDHSAMLSVSFLVTEPFKSILFQYDFVLRSDQDAIITPRILSWRPPCDMVFGKAHYEGEWTKKRLKLIAKELGWSHRGVHSICSAWYVRPHVALALAEHTIRAAHHLLDNEYGYRPNEGYMAPRVKLGDMEWWSDESSEGEWPKWYRGVTSLYASHLAINHLVTNLTDSFVTGDLDWSTTDRDRVMGHVHLHCIHAEGGFNKFNFLDEMFQEQGASTYNMNGHAMLGHFLALNRRMQREHGLLHQAPLHDTTKYSMWIVSRGLAMAASAFHREAVPNSNQYDWMAIVSRRGRARFA